MANKTIDLNRSAASGSYIIGKIVCDATADYGLNNSDVTCRIYVHKGNDSTLLTIPTSGTWAYSMNINGKAFSGSVKKDVLLDWVLLATVSVSDIAHNDDGTKSIAISGSVTAPSTSVVVGHKTSGSGTFTLDTVPRASTIAAVSNRYLGEYCAVRWTPLSKSFRYRLKFSMSNWEWKTDAIHPNQTTSYLYTGYLIPLDVAFQIPNNTTGKMSVTLLTYSDSSATVQVGSADSEVFTVTVPDNEDTKPYATEMTLMPVSSLEGDFAGLYIQGLSKVKATVSTKGQYGASVAWQSVTVEGKNYGVDSNYTSDYLSGYGTIYVKLTIQDTRGFTNSKTLSITVIPYAKPRVIPVIGMSSIVCARCDVDGNLTDSGTYLRIKARRSFSICMADGVQKNFCGLRFRYKRISDSDYSAWQDLLLTTNTTTEEVDTVVLGGALATTTSYVVQLDAVDSISNHTYVTFDIPTEEVYLHRAGNIGSLGIGEYVEDSNIISIAKNKAIRMKSNINGVRMASVSVSGTKELNIKTKYTDFTGNGNERQTFFVFGEANGAMVYGVARAANNGTTLWAGTNGVTLTTKSDGVLTVVLPTVAYDTFTIISGRDFTV